MGSACGAWTRSRTPHRPVRCATVVAASLAALVCAFARESVIALGRWEPARRASYAANGALGERQHVLTAYPVVSLHAATLADAQSLFYNGRYPEAAAVALTLRSSDPDDLAAHELRTSALLFQLRSLLGQGTDRQKALAQCPGCPTLMAAFHDDTRRGQALARARLKAQPRDDVALFFLGKLNLNYVWLELGTLGRRTGWNEYWEARRSLDEVLGRDPAHVRARVARAWIDYIVDTKLPRGTKWLLGGGDRGRALTVVREAAATDAERFARAEAAFALWEMQVREGQTTEATKIARELVRDFPRNRQLASFLDTPAPTRRGR